VRRRVATIVAVLLVAAAGLLVVGVLLERRAEPGNEHPTVATTGEQQEGHHGESTEGTHSNSAPPANGGGEAVERLTGVNVESPLIVTLGPSRRSRAPSRCGGARHDRSSRLWWRSRPQR